MMEQYEHRKANKTVHVMNTDGSAAAGKEIKVLEPSYSVIQK